MSTPNHKVGTKLLPVHKEEGGIQFEYDVAPFSLTEDAISGRKRETAPVLVLPNGTGTGRHANAINEKENGKVIVEDGLQPDDFMWVEEADIGEADLGKQAEKVRLFAAVLISDNTGREFSKVAAKNQTMGEMCIYEYQKSHCFVGNHACRRKRTPSLTTSWTSISRWLMLMHQWRQMATKTTGLAQYLQYLILFLGRNV